MFSLEDLVKGRHRQEMLLAHVHTTSGGSNCVYFRDPGRNVWITPGDGFPKTKKIHAVPKR